MESTTIELQEKPPREFELNEQTNLTEFLSYLQTDFSDNIPENVLHSHTPEIKVQDYKVRKAWWTKLTCSIDLMIEQGLIADVDTLERANDFFNLYTSEEFTKQRLVSTEDINRANAMINKILGKSEYPVPTRVLVQSAA